MKVVEIHSHQVEEFHSLKPDNLFTSKDWCHCYDEKLRRFFITDEGGKAIGGFVAFEGGRYGIKTLITPPYSPHIGLFVIESRKSISKENTLRKQVIAALAEFLGKSSYGYYKIDLAPEWNDMQPMIWKKISALVRYTYRLDLRQEAEVINGNLDPKTRNMITKAQRENVQVVHDYDADLGIAMVMRNLASKSVFAHRDILENIIKYSCSNTTGLWSIVKKEETTLAVNICIQDGNDCYNLLSAIDRDSKQNYSGAFSLYQSILSAREHGLAYFDFEGSGIPEIETFFRSFGGELTPYFSVSGGKWPWTLWQRFRKK